MIIHFFRKIFSEKIGLFTFFFFSYQFLFLHTFVYTQLSERIDVVAKPITSFQSLNTFPKISSDGNGGFWAVYRSKRNNSSVDLLYAQRVSPDGKRIPVADGVQVASSTVTQYEHQVISDRMGGIFVVWQEKKEGVDFFQIYAQHINSKGESLWGRRGILITDSEYSQSKVQMISDPDVGLLIFWQEERGSNFGKDIFGQRINKIGKISWGRSGKPIVRARGNQQNIKLVNGKSKVFFIIWEDDNPNEENRIMAQRINSEGELQWPNYGIVISGKECINSKSPSVCSDHSGGFLCTYQSMKIGEHHNDIYVTRVNSSSDIIFSRAVCEAEEEQNEPNVILDDYKIIVYWKDYRNGKADIYTQKVTFVQGKVGWVQNGKLLVSDVQNRTNLQIIIPPDTSDRLIIFENQLDGKDIFAGTIHYLNYEVKSGEAFPIANFSGDQYDFQLQIDDSKKGLWIVWVDDLLGYHNTIRFKYLSFGKKKSYGKKEKDFRGDNLMLSHESAIAAVDNPYMAPGKFDDLYIAWEDYRNGKKNADIYMQRYNSKGLPMWQTNGIPICGAPGEQSTPKLLPTKSGVFVVWGDRRNNDDDLYIQFVDSLGKTSFPIFGLPLVTKPRTQNSVHMCELNDERIFITWTDARNFNELGFDIYFQLVDKSGNFYYRKDGVPVDLEKSYQTSGTLIPDKKGGTYLFWMDERYGPYQILGQHFSPYAKKIWTLPALEVCLQSQHQRFPKSTSLSNGDAIVAWNDDRNGNLNTKVYFQRIDSAGKFLFDPKGVAVCGATGRQSSVEVLSDNLNGFVTAWLDQRDEKSTGYNIYAQRFYMDGERLWKTEGVQLGEYLTSNNHYHMVPGKNCNLLITWSQFISDFEIKSFWVEADLDSGEILRHAIVDVEGSIQTKPYIYQFENQKVAILWLAKVKNKFNEMLKISFFN